MNDDYKIILTDVMESNEIDDLPPITAKRVRSKFYIPKEIREEMERTREMKEGEFRKWLVKQKPKNCVLVPIETSTATGVPDLYSCYDGCQQWIECKIATSHPPHIRGTQFVFFTKLLAAGGKGKLVVQRLNCKDYKPSSVEIYDMEDVIKLPPGLFKRQGQDMVLPASLKPSYKWTYKRKKNADIEDMYLHLLLDSNKFTW